MKSDHPHCKIAQVAVFILAAAISPIQLSAGTPSSLSSVTEVEVEEPQGPPLLEVKLDASYSFGGETEFDGNTFDDSDAFNINFSALTFLPLSEHWSMPFQLESQNVVIGSLDGVPMPDSIHMMEFGSGLAYRPNDRWMWMARVNAQLYKFEDLGSDDIGVSAGLMVEWQYSSSMKWVFGFMYQPNNSMPLIPLVGGEWQINDHWQLLMTFPQPRLVYSPGSHWSFHVGMDLILGTTFRTSDTLGSSMGLPKYDGEIGSYSDTRVGGGFSYQLTRALSLEFEGGMSMGRHIEYEDIDEKIEFDSAPYVRLGLRLEF